MRSYSGTTEFEFTIYREDINGDEQEILLTVKGNSYFAPGKTYGDPYDCYPDESEIEILKVTGPDNTDWSDRLTEQEVSEIEDKINLDVQDLCDSFDEDKYDSMRNGDWD